MSSNPPDPNADAIVTALARFGITATVTPPRHHGSGTNTAWYLVDFGDGAGPVNIYEPAMVSQVNALAAGTPAAEVKQVAMAARP